MALLSRLLLVIVLVAAGLPRLAQAQQSRPSSAPPSPEPTSSVKSLWNPVASYPAPFPCNAANREKVFHVGLQSVKDHDSWSAYRFASEGDAFGQCYLTYPDPLFLFYKAFAFYIAATILENRGDHVNAVRKLKISYEALVDFNRYQLPAVWQRNLNWIRTDDDALDLRIMKDAVLTHR
jgi:hypothetical protein